VAVVLVAGVGERLRPVTSDRPKALVAIGEETLLARSLRLLVAHGVQQVVLATGYRDDAVRAATRSPAVPVHYCLNPAYDRTQNSMSLLACEQAVGGRSFYKLDGDLLFCPEVLHRLDRSDAGIVAAVDRRAMLAAEEMKVQIGADARTIQAFGKQLSPAACHGESIGIERVNGFAVSRLFRGLASARDRGDTQLYYEDIYARLIQREGVVAEAVDVSDLPWAEVDTADDLMAARQLVARGVL
jgi:choline kinase